MVIDGHLAAKVATRCRAEPGDLCAGTRMAWSHGQPTVCRNEDVAYERIYAQPCIIFHDSANALTSPLQLLRDLFM